MHTPPAAVEAPAAVDLEVLREEVYTTIQSSFDNAIEAIVVEASKHYTATSEAAIPGLRQQIIANVTVLAPYLKSSTTTSVAVTTAAVDNTSSAAELQIITLGVEPAVRACVFTSGSAVAKKLIHSEAASNSAGALSNLLKKTEALLSDLINISPSKKAKLSKASTCVGTVVKALATQVPALKAVIKHSRGQSVEGGYWDSLGINNRNFHDECAGYESGGGDSGFDSGDSEPHPNRSFATDRNVAARVPKVEETSVACSVVKEEEHDSFF